MNDVDAAISYMADTVTTVKFMSAKLASMLLLRDSAFAQGFGSRAGSDHSHHAYIGGLPIHTAEVLEIGLSMAASRNLHVDLDVLIVASIFHDYMKVRDYDENGQSTLYRNQVRHVAGSYAAWERIAESECVAPLFVDKVSHCILAHHGRQEWGSPILPQTPEAQILHYADMMSQLYGRKRVDINA